MGTQCSQIELSMLWEKLPEGREIIITRDRIAVKNTYLSPTLDVENRVIHQDIGECLVSKEDYRSSHAAKTVVSESEYGLSGAMETRGMRRSSLLIRRGQDSEKGRVISKNDVSEEPSVIVFESAPDASEVQIDSKSILGETHAKIKLEELNFYNLSSYSVLCDSWLNDKMITTRFPTITSLDGNSEDIERIFQKVDEESEVLNQISSMNMTGKKSREELEESEQKVMPGVKKERSLPLKTEDGVIITKKLATQQEQKGKRECHVYFTPRTASEIWPHLVVTVGESWQLLKVMRKSIANIQRTIRKGDREGTHDWVFAYHPNKEIRKIKSELKVLFGRKALVCIGGNLKKQIKDMTNDFIINLWILQKRS